MVRIANDETRKAVRRLRAAFVVPQRATPARVRPRGCESRRSITKIYLKPVSRRDFYPPGVGPHAPRGTRQEFSCQCMVCAVRCSLLDMEAGMKRRLSMFVLAAVLLRCQSVSRRVLQLYSRSRAVRPTCIPSCPTDHTSAFGPDSAAAARRPLSGSTRAMVSIAHPAGICGALEESRTSCMFTGLVTLRRL
jgi:hypothetical protein